MVVFQREDFDVETQKQGRATRSVPYFNSVIHWEHRVYGIPEFMLQFVTIQFTETDPYLG